MRKNRIQALEKLHRHKHRPNNGCAKINYLDNPMSEKEKQELLNQGITIIDVVYT